MVGRLIYLCLVALCLPTMGEAGELARDQTGGKAGFSLILPKRISEGSVGSGSIKLSKPATQTLTVYLTRSGSALSIPYIVSIPAGRSSVRFQMSFPWNDNERDDSGLTTVEASLDGTRVSGSLVLLDQTPFRVVFEPLPKEIPAGNLYTLQFRLFTKDDKPVNRLQFPIKVNLLLGLDNLYRIGEIKPAGSLMKGRVMIPYIPNRDCQFLLTIGRLNETSKTVELIVPETPAPLQETYIAPRSIAWNPVNKRIYGSVGPASGKYRFYLAEINPANGSITRKLKLNQEPSNIAVTSDGSALYVVGNQGGNIIRVKLPSFTVDSTFKLGKEYHSIGFDQGLGICTIPNKPDDLVVCERKGYGGRVAVWSKGVMKPQVVERNLTDVVVSGTDPTCIYGVAHRGSVLKLRLTEEGIVEDSWIGRYDSAIPPRISVDGDLIVLSQGEVFDGRTMQRVGEIPGWGYSMTFPGSGRIFRLHPGPDGDVTDYFTNLTVYDLLTRNSIRSVRLGTEISPSRDSNRQIISCGGLTLASNRGPLTFIREPLTGVVGSADLLVKLVPPVTPIQSGRTADYTLEVTNKGKESARAAMVMASITNGTFGPPRSPGGRWGVKRTPETLEINLKTLEPGSTLAIKLPVKPTVAGALFVRASAFSATGERDYSNNGVVGRVETTFEALPNTLNEIDLAVHDMVSDRKRGLLWAITTSHPKDPGKAVVVSIQPESGQIRSVIQLGGTTRNLRMKESGPLSISANGRYLYAGLGEPPRVARIDLDSAPVQISSIPWDPKDSGSIVPWVRALGGSGTRFIIRNETYPSYSIYQDGQALFDVAEEAGGEIFIKQLESLGLEDQFVSYLSDFNDATIKRLQITPTGVSELLSKKLKSENKGMDVDGDWLLTGGGRLVDARTLEVVRDYGVSGHPCLDAATRKAFFVTSKQLLAYSFDNGALVGSLPHDFARNVLDQGECIRWGTDGLAIFWTDSPRIRILRWDGVSNQLKATPPAMAKRISESGAAVVSPDTDGDGMADALEWVLGCSPSTPGPCPVRIIPPQAGDPGLVRVELPRRSGMLVGTSYDYETSTDLRTWTPIGDVTESVISTENRDEVELERVRASFRAAPTAARFVRIRLVP